MRLGSENKVGAWIINDFFFFPFVTEALRHLKAAV